MGMQDQLSAENKLSKTELKKIYGGTAISPTIISAFTSSFKVIYEIGQNFGTSIRRIIMKDLCGL